MEEFINLNFIGHPCMAALTLEHILTSRVNPKRVKTLKDQMQTIKEQLGLIQQNLDKVCTKTDVKPNPKRFR